MNSSEADNNCCGRSYSVTMAVVLACLVFVGLVWKMRQYATPEPLGAERGAERAKALQDIRAVETDALNNVGWIDQTKGLVRLPVAEAMKLTERAWQNPAQARADLLARVEKANAKPPEKPSEFE
jgi:hypothetical protein